jgi:serine/threonine protein kinase
VLINVQEDSGSLILLKYTYTPGVHEARCFSQFTDVLLSLKRVHDAGLVHADVRASNIVFASDAPSHLIDFDFTGPTTATYPNGYAPGVESRESKNQIRDTERHPNAEANANLSPDHDRHSMAWLMKQHSAIDHPTLWEQATHVVHDVEQPLQRAVELLRTQPSSQLSLSEPWPTRVQTGTPRPSNTSLSPSSGKKRQSETSLHDRPSKPAKKK